MLNKNKKTAFRLLCSIHRKTKGLSRDHQPSKKIPTREHLGGTNDLN